MKWFPDQRLGAGSYGTVFAAEVKQGHEWRKCAVKRFTWLEDENLTAEERRSAPAQISPALIFFLPCCEGVSTGRFAAQGASASTQLCIAGQL